MIALVFRLAWNFLDPDDVADDRVREGEHGQGKEVLEDHEYGRVDVSVIAIRPLLLALIQDIAGHRIGRVHDFRQDGDRKWNDERQDPDVAEYDDDGFGGETGTEREDDRPEPIDADADQGEGAEEDRHDLEVCDDGAEEDPEGPVMDEHVGDEGGRDADDGGQHIGAGEVQDEVIGDRVHPSASEDGVDDQRIPAHGNDDHGEVKDGEDDLGDGGDLVVLRLQQRIIFFRLLLLMSYILGDVSRWRGSQCSRRYDERKFREFEIIIFIFVLA